MRELILTEIGRLEVHEAPIPTRAPTKCSSAWWRPGSADPTSTGTPERMADAFPAR